MFEGLRRHPRWWAAFAGLLVVAIPILLALRLASLQSLRQQEREATLLANAVLLRTHEIGDQVRRAESSAAAPGLRLCSPEYLQYLVRASAENPLLVAVGRMEGNRLTCSSFGPIGADMDVGPMDYRSARGHDIRAARSLPRISDHPAYHFDTDPVTGFTVIIHTDLAIGTLTANPGISLGVVNLSTGTVLVRRGIFDTTWIKALGQAEELRFSDGRYVVAMQRSDRYDFATYAAIPVAAVDQGTASLILLLGPLGIGSGFMLAYLVFRFTQRRMSIIWQFKQALRRHELSLVYQPIVNLQSGRWVGAEALLRWRRTDGTMVSPDVFIPMAERHHLIRQVTTEVIRLFAQDLQELLRSRTDFYISVNFSPADLEDSTQVDTLHRTVVNAGLRPGNVQVEATERGLLDTDQTRGVLRHLRTQGIRIAIDDFGTGYSSLSYLTTLDLDCLKIDRSFVETIGTDAATSQVVAHVIEIAKSLKLTMIAEGVETEAQADYLRAHGVQYAQGWLFAKPLSTPDLIRRLEQQEAEQTGKPG